MRMLKAGLGLLWLLSGICTARADEAGTDLLDQFSSWRMYHVLKSPEIAFDDGARPVVYPKSFRLNGQTPPPPADWTKPEFDDASWLRGICNYTNQLHDYSAPWRWKFQTGEAGHAWLQSMGWRERNTRLFALAGEVESKLGAK